MVSFRIRPKAVDRQCGACLGAVGSAGPAATTRYRPHSAAARPTDRAACCRSPGVRPARGDTATAPPPIQRVVWPDLVNAPQLGCQAHPGAMNRGSGPTPPRSRSCVRESTVGPLEGGTSTATRGPGPLDSRLQAESGGRDGVIAPRNETRSASQPNHQQAEVRPTHQAGGEPGHAFELGQDSAGLVAVEDLGRAVQR
jgi:hypothetical protein